MPNYQEILTRAVVYKKEINYQKEITIEVPQDVSKLLGCWIINQKVQAFVDSSALSLTIDYDAHLWVGLDNDKDSLIIKKHQQTKISKQVEFTSLNDDNEAKVYVHKYPSCVKLVKEESVAKGIIEANYEINIIGEALIKVQIEGNSFTSLDEEIDQSIDVNNQ